MSTDSLPNLPSSEDLDAVAEEARIAEATVTSSNESKQNVVEMPSSDVPPTPPITELPATNPNAKCFLCGADAVRICSHCGQELCSQHSCPSHEMQTQREVVMDDDGTERRGTRIRLIGEGWPNDIRRIKDMSDEELEGQIKGLQGLLKRAVETQDYAQISIASREFELSYRKHSRYVTAMKRREKLQQGSVKLNSKKHRPGGVPSDILAMMKAFNLSQAEAEALKQALGGKK